MGVVTPAENYLYKLSLTRVLRNYCKFRVLCQGGTRALNLLQTPNEIPFRN